MDSGFNTELWLVLAVMLVLLIFAIAAVVIFFRVWRKERGQGAKTNKPQINADKRG